MTATIGERAGFAGVAALAEASRAIAAGDELQPTLETVVRGAAEAVGAEVGVLWLRDRDGLAGSERRD